MNEPSRKRPPGLSEAANSRFFQRLALLSQFLGELVGVTALGLAFDYYEGTSPWGAIGFGVIGILGSLYLLVKRVLSTRD